LKRKFGAERQSSWVDIRKSLAAPARAWRGCSDPLYCETFPATSSPSAKKAVDAFVKDLDAEEISITSEIGRRAVDASANYGNAVGHVADLNFGDCFSYACAKTLNVALLYKGDDFAHTDLA